jgi:hypothetical protein
MGEPYATIGKIIIPSISLKGAFISSNNAAKITFKTLIEKSLKIEV